MKLPINHRDNHRTTLWVYAVLALILSALCAAAVILPERPGTTVEVSNAQ